MSLGKMCQYGTCTNDAQVLVKSAESGELVAVCDKHRHVGKEV